MQAAGVAACAKHFPGHGDTNEDSHLALPRVDHPLGRLREVELVPFRAAALAGVASMMTAHVLLPCFDPRVPATLCSAAIDLLRGEIDYDGVVFGDDFEMAAVARHFPPREATRRAVEAGVDALLVCSRADVRDLVLAELEALPAALLEPGLRRVAELKHRFAAGRHAGSGSPPYPEHARLAAQLAGQRVGST
jgi:beta-N-acetylhexosaminidase